MNTKSIKIVAALLLIGTVVAIATFDKPKPLSPQQKKTLLMSAQILSNAGAAALQAAAEPDPPKAVKPEPTLSDRIGKTYTNCIMTGYMLGAMGATPDDIRVILSACSRSGSLGSATDAWIAQQTNGYDVHPKIKPQDLAELLRAWAVTAGGQL